MSSPQLPCIHRAVPLVLLLLALFTPVHFAAAQGQAFNDAGSISTQHPDWMRGLADTTSLAAISLPGTHQTMASTVAGDDRGMVSLLVLGQSLGLRAQLDAGIRVLDIRVRHFGNGFILQRGAYYLGTNFDDVLGISVQFLQQHPSETILMRLKQEYESNSTTRSFADTFEAYRQQAAYTQFIWDGTTLPTLQQVRGKIVILDDFSGGVYGIRWGALDIQDEDIDTDTDIDAKWTLVRDQLARANASDSSKLYVNFASADCSSYAWDCATEHNPKLIASHLNPAILNHLAGGHVQHTGVLMMDFPGAGLIDAIIARNFQPTAEHFRTGDYNGDGRTDESWYSPRTNEFIVMLSNGQGGFTPTRNNTSAWGKWSDARFFSTGDYNGDRRTDWSWYAPRTNEFIVMLSNGQGGFTPVYNNTYASFGAWSDARFFSTGDYNGDRRTDWSWYAPWSRDFIVMLSNGQGGFSPVYNYTYASLGDWSGARFFSTGDYNGDRRTDWSWYAPWNQNFIVMLSNGKGGFTPVYNYTYASFEDWSKARFFNTGDYNADGRTDWSWYASWNQNFIVMTSNGQGGFTPVYTPWNFPGMP